MPAGGDPNAMYGPVRSDTGMNDSATYIWPAYTYLPIAQLCDWTAAPCFAHSLVSSGFREPASIIS